MGVCRECKKITGYKWCNKCNAKHFQENFKKWRSEWIPYDRFYDINYIAKGALKSLYNSKNITSDFINEITSHHKIIEDYTDTTIIRLYGITQDPETKNYMMVLHYAENGSLRNYLDKNYQQSNWKTKFGDLWDIAFGLEEIHKKELIHRDLHIGNILYSSFACITDMGLCKPADYNTIENTTKRVYGVLPYIAPEVLGGQIYTKASDIYSFGLRPRFNIKVPQLIVHLIKRCLDANPLNRPAANEISDIIELWYFKFNGQIELQRQIEEADEINNNNLQTSSAPSTSLATSSYKTHSEAIYTSRSLNFNNLPEPKNSDDYYKQHDNIISMEYSGIN
ncbi:kinase-like domain-containing protein [Glomus cerebriforme]|uniref:Kinase-like domain-containing protein n=1 Tax=Glomus cerebriforme TaxID=658196 RepID=A0A397T5Q7_9GLOM|nr:kinase-like domain-containing protein [Glomus cerebriforme]